MTLPRVLVCPARRLQKEAFYTKMNGMKRLCKVSSIFALLAFLSTGFLSARSFAKNFGLSLLRSDQIQFISPEAPAAILSSELDEKNSVKAVKKIVAFVFGFLGQKFPKGFFKAEFDSTQKIQQKHFDKFKVHFVSLQTVF